MTIIHQYHIFMTFPKSTYEERRRALRDRLAAQGGGIILLMGNNDSPINYPANAYHYRQDSNMLYYTGQERDGLALAIDCATGDEILFGNDIDLDDIVWMGFTPSVADLAAESGIAKSLPMSQLKQWLQERKNAPLHILPPYRPDTVLQLMDLLDKSAAEVKALPSLKLIKAVIDQRAVKTQEEIEEIERACAIGYEMHTMAMRMCRPGVTEREIAGAIEGIALAKGLGFSFQPIVSMHGEIAHGYPKARPLEAGKLLLCDAGAETLGCYASDNTRTMPVSGKFDSRQRDIYSIVRDAHHRVLEVAGPGKKWYDIHFEAARVIADGLKDVGLLKGSTDDILEAGAHAAFFTHGLGHMMGMDVHDMEGLGQIHVGFDEEVQPRLDQFGTNFLRCGRRLQPGWVMTDEPGIYFIPHLLDSWRAEGRHKDFINYDLAETYKDFGGVRLEDDLLVTEDGCRLLGEKQIPIEIDDVEATVGTL